MKKNEKNKSKLPEEKERSINRLNILEKELNEKNIKLFRKTVELKETLNELEDKNLELQELNREINQKNVKLFRNTVDLTEARNSLEDALMKVEEVNKQLLLLDHTKSEFISIASHELRTPLTSVIGFIEILLDEPEVLNDQDKTKEMLEISFNEAKRLHRLINDILNLSKMESGKMDFNFQLESIRNIVESIYTSMKIIAKKKGIKMCVEFDNVPRIKVDRIRIEEAISNLINNAIKILDSGKTIYLKLNRVDDRIIIAVKDNGPGIPENRMHDLFKPFMQVGSVEQHHEGTGLGLVIAKRIIEAHNGNIDVKSVFGKETTFTVSLPINKQ